ncbi:SpoIIE family protein phosphatase [Streptomyces sp. NPDC049577]|uniref:SpoIIE family protein phosphatase n=1 Tax=Streptomyces sp. NPDC049577 TaxID=3155153 RepID=UPI0034181BCB
MTSDSVDTEQADAASDAVSDVVALAKVVAKLRTEKERLEHLVRTITVLERAKGVLMARTGCSATVAYEELTRRAAEAGRTVTEECWIALGEIQLRPVVPAERAAEPVRVKTGGSVFDPARYTVRGVPRPRSAAPSGGSDGTADVLRRLGAALTDTATPQELAQCLLDHLGAAADTDAVMIYTRPPAGGLRLVGHAGVGATVAAQWRHVPPLSGVAALDAIASGEAVWLEDPARDKDRYLLIGDPPERWPCRAWIPVSTGGAVTSAIGVFRTLDAPFDPGTRELLHAVARLCAGRLRAFDAPRGRSTAPTAAVVQAAFDTLSEPAALLTPLRSPTGQVEDFRIDAAAPESVDVAGRRGRELVGLRVLECYPTMAGLPAWQGYLATLATGRPYQSRPFRYHEVVAGVPQASTFSVRAVKLEDSLVVSWIRHDTVARQQQRLADLQRLGNLGWADWNLVTDEVNWSPQVYAVFERDPALGPMRLEALPEHVLPEDLPALAQAVQDLLTHGRPMDRPFRITTDVGVKHLRIVAEAVTDVNGTPIEVHCFVQDLTAQRRAELALAESERAVHSQRGVLQTERTIAARLQHALLPLPEQSLTLADLRVDVAYLPSDDGINVGGDWYSAIELPDGSVLFVVGDVAGHGIDAVATMAQLRFTTKGMIVTGSSLTGALDRLNTLLLHTRDAHTSTATVVIARYEPARRRLTWAQAGHPPLLLLRGGRAQFLTHPRGILLGATPDASYGEAEFRLEPGDHLLFYTDGLVERPREHIDEGANRFADAARQAIRSDGTGSLGPLLSSLLRDERRDDVCLLDVHLPLDAGPPRGHGDAPDSLPWDRKPPQPGEDP